MFQVRGLKLLHFEPQRHEDREAEGSQESTYIMSVPQPKAAVSSFGFQLQVLAWTFDVSHLTGYEFSHGNIKLVVLKLFT